MGFASEAGGEDDSQAKPERVKLAVLVFLTKAHGSEAAEIARPIFDEFTRSRVENVTADEETRGILPSASLSLL